MSFENTLVKIRVRMIEPSSIESVMSTAVYLSASTVATTSMRLDAGLGEPGLTRGRLTGFLVARGGEFNTWVMP